MNLNGKKIILGISGSIAAYKTPELVRQLIKAGAEVKVILTPSAKDFVSPLALSTVSKNEVYHEIASQGHWHNHVALGLWADVFLIAPASANTLAKMAHGLCDNMLLAAYLSCRCPVIIAPAMDEDMWLHEATQQNIALLSSRKVKTIPVGVGELASGLVGPGRMAEIQDIVAYLDDFFKNKNSLSGKKCVVTAGPTYEKLDPVRFIGNYSTGKMGIAISEALANHGAEVTLVLGPTALRPNASFKNIALKLVESADEMYEAVDMIFNSCDVAVMSAAVADYKPKTRADQKIKKSDDDMVLSLSKNKDILGSMGAKKRPDQVLVGFALETTKALEYGVEKMKRKNADLMVINSLEDEGAGFGHDTNKVILVKRDGEKINLPLQSKKELANEIVSLIINQCYEKK